MNITTQTEFEFRKKQEDVYEINYGNISRGSDSKIVIKFTDASHINVKKSCGCTTPTIEIGNNGFNLHIQYDTNKGGTINQWVKETYQDKSTKKQQEIKIELKGTVI